jgi:hypothetical protein
VNDSTTRSSHVFGDGVKALIELAAACQIALDALPRLGRQTEDSLRPHIEALCEVTDRELKDRGVVGDRNSA